MIKNRAYFGLYPAMFHLPSLNIAATEHTGCSNSANAPCSKIKSQAAFGSSAAYVTSSLHRNLRILLQQLLFLECCNRPFHSPWL